jgi:uncharacterized membrane protein YfcA
MTPLDYALVALVLAFASFVQSASGFGFALVAVAALPQIIGLEPAIALIAAFNLLVSISTLWWNKKDFSWSKAWPLTLAICITLPIGFWFLKNADGTLLIRVLGVILITVAVMDLRLSVPAMVRARLGKATVTVHRKPKAEERASLPAWSVWPLGLIGGVLGGAFNVAGPPVVAFAYSQPWSKTQTVAVLQTVFLLAGLMRNGMMVVAGDYNAQLFRWILCSIPAAMIAIWLGKLLLDRLPKNLLKLAVFTFILVMGVKYLVVGMG